MATVDERTGLVGRSVTGGRLDAAAALAWTADAPEDHPAPAPGPRFVAATATAFRIASPRRYCASDNRATVA